MGQIVSSGLHHFWFFFLHTKLGKDTGGTRILDFQKWSNLVVDISLNQDYSGDSNGGICVTIPALGVENRGLLCFCLPTLPRKSPRGTGSYYTPLERYSRGDCSAVGIVGNGSVVVEKFREQAWQMWISGGELILEVCLGLSVVWIATYSYLICCHRLCEKGDGSFIWNLMWRIQESWVNIRLPLISFISFLLHIGFWSNLGPTESCFKENLTLLRARRLEKNSWRTLEVTGTNQLT